MRERSYLVLQTAAVHDVVPSCQVEVLRLVRLFQQTPQLSLAVLCIISATRLSFCDAFNAASATRAAASASTATLLRSHFVAGISFIASHGFISP